MTPTTRGPRFRGETGASLALALAFLSLLGVFSASILTLTDVSFKNTQVARARASQLYSADGGVEYGIRALQTDATWCSSATAGLQSLGSQVISDRTVSVTCLTTVGNSQPSSGSLSPLLGAYVAIATGAEGISVDGPGNGLSMHFLGDVYSGGPVDPGASTVAVDGSLGLVDPACPYDATTNPSVVGTCTASQPVPTVPNPVPTVVVPSTAALASTSNGSSCTILYPGKYGTGGRTKPTFAVNRHYYFASGTYYFNDVGDLDLQGRSVFGGAPGSETKKLTTANPCATDEIAKAEEPTYDPAGSGVTIILGGNSVLRVQGTNSNIELYSRVPGGADAGATPGVSIWARTDTQGVTGGAYSPVTQTVLRTEHKATNLVVHGLTYVPSSKTWLRVLANTAAGGTAMFLGGIVARELHFELDNNAGVVGVAGGGAVTPPQPRTVTIVATSTGTDGQAPTVIEAVVRPDTSPVQIVSWRKLSTT